MRNLRKMLQKAQREMAVNARARLERAEASQSQAVRDKAQSEFYQEVKIALMIDLPCVEKVAISLIDTPEKLNAQANRLGL